MNQRAATGGASAATSTRDEARTEHRESTVDYAWLAIAVTSLAGFALLAWMVASKVVFPFDQPLLDLARGWNGLAGLWDLLSIAAYLPLAAAAVGFIAWLWVNHMRREAVIVIVLLAGVTAGSEAVKEIVARPRPPDTNTVVPGVVYSFPSGHALEGVTILGIMALTAWRMARSILLRAGAVLVAVVLVALLAVARVSLDAHYPSDVLGGFLGGFGFLGAFAWLTRSWWADGPQQDT